MAEDIEKIKVQFEAETRRLQTALTAAERKVDRFEKRTKTSTRAVQANFSKLKPVIATAIGALTVRSAARLADAYTEINSRLRLVTSSSEEFAKAQKGVFDIAQASRQSFGATAELYQRLAQSSDSLRGDQERLLKVTEIVNKAIAAGGTSAASAQAAIVQLGQGLSAGALRGQEFNSVVEQTPRLAQALAQGLNKNIGELRALSQQGALTSDVIIKALENQANAVDRDFGKVNATIGQALTELDNAFTLVIGGAADASGAQALLTTAISDFAKALSDPAIKDGIARIATDAVKAFTTLTEAIATARNVLHFLGEELASEIGGPALDDIPRVSERVDELTEKVAELKQELSRANSSRSSAGRGQIAEELAEAQAELAKYQGALEQALNTQNKLTGGSVSAGSAKTQPENIKPVQLPDGVNEKYETLLRSLRQQVATQKEATKVAEVRAKIETGAIGKVTDEQYKLLLQEAKRIDNAERLADIQKEVEALRVESLSEEVRAVEELQEKYATLATAVKEGQLKPEEAADIAKGLAENFEKQKDKTAEAGNEMSKFAETAAENMQSAFADFLFDPFDEGLDGMLKNFQNIIQRMIAEAMAAQAIQALFSAFGVPTGAGGGLDFSGIFGGGKASGGPVDPSKFYVVGESGPELFVPDTAGKIVPNSEMLMSTNNINLTVPMMGNERDSEIKRSAAQLARQLKTELSRV